MCAQRRPRSAGHPFSLIKVFAVRMKNHWVISYPKAHSEDWSDWAEAQADLSLRWAHSYFIGVVVLRLKSNDFTTP